jgi:threonine/homoserine/homoserine lactone efflux protein
LAGCVILETFEMLEILGLAGPRDLALFMGAVFVLNATPGVDLLLTVSRTLQGGASAGVAAALGVNAGCVLHALGAAFGLAAVLAVSPLAFAAIKWAGAAYLAWVGWGLLRQAWRGSGEGAELPACAPPVSTRPGPQGRLLNDFRTGLLTNLLNPKVLLFFLAFLPQFIAPSAPHKTGAFLGLGAVFVVQSTLFLLAVVWATVQLLRMKLPSFLGRGVQAVAGTLFICLAWRLLDDRMAHA